MAFGPPKGMTNRRRGADAHVRQVPSQWIRLRVCRPAPPVGFSTEQRFSPIQRARLPAFSQKNNLATDEHR